MRVAKKPATAKAKAKCAARKHTASSTKATHTAKQSATPRVGQKSTNRVTKKPAASKKMMKQVSPTSTNVEPWVMPVPAPQPHRMYECYVCGNTYPYFDMVTELHGYDLFPMRSCTWCWRESHSLP